MFAKPLHVAVFCVTCCSSVAMAQLVPSAKAASKDNEKIWVLNPDSLSDSSIPDSAFYAAAKLPGCMDLGNGCLNENFDYNKVNDQMERDKCRNGDDDCYLTKNLNAAKPLIGTMAQPFIYNHEKRERANGNTKK